MSTAKLKAPFAWFGGKRLVADIVWKRFGLVDNYIEPFFGSGAVLLGRIEFPKIHTETVCDKDGYISNFWRAIQSDPDKLIKYLSMNPSTVDMHARRNYVVARKDKLIAKLEADPMYCNYRIAGYWLYAINLWIGSRFMGKPGKQLLHISDRGVGINRVAIAREKFIKEWMYSLHIRMRDVRVDCGDWTRISKKSNLRNGKVTAVFLDPPYAKYQDIYSANSNVHSVIQAWCIANGDNPKLRIAVCGFKNEYKLPGWKRIAWSRRATHGASKTANLERIWFSPACIIPEE